MVDTDKASDNQVYAEAVMENNPEIRRKVTDVFSRDEIKSLTKRSDLYGWYAFIVGWGGIALCFAWISLASHLQWYFAVPLIIIGTALLAGRQLSMSMAIHEASHGTLFKTKWLNNVFADWVFGKSQWNSLNRYRPYHFKHHTKTATKDDPDLVLSKGYPTTRMSMTRKFIRDLTGYVGIRYIIAQLLMDFELIEPTFTGQVIRKPRKGRSIFSHVMAFARNAGPTIAINIALYLLLDYLGYGWAYACWPIAYLTFFMFYMRIRSMAEHAGLEKTSDMFRNTRTIKSNWLTNLTVSPLNVNYHMEHHVLASCPYFNLPKVHRLLLQQNMVPKPPSYWDILKELSSANTVAMNKHINRVG